MHRFSPIIAQPIKNHAFSDSLITIWPKPQRPSENMVAVLSDGLGSAARLLPGFNRVSTNCPACVCRVGCQPIRPANIRNRMKSMKNIPKAV
ncbi:hypothetical protein [Neisseria sp. 19428wB4_WF04]|uniref:hypothetical protein n=1 Tax=Neisseria sp. 19428wB4_WF04 TaxID=2782469 RepID=UPI00107284F4|nr:hypothetical protein [Neisseria sp. 19428wB4_WF04]TFU42773.1 hypothetical protein E4T99_08860 [Neisseria sp. WF04]